MFTNRNSQFVGNANSLAKRQCQNAKRTSILNYLCYLLLIFSLLIQSGCRPFTSLSHKDYQECNRLKLLAEFAEEEGKYDSAAKIWKQASRFNNDEEVCLLRCAENHCKNEEYNHATSVLEDALVSHQENFQVHLKLAEAQFKAGNRKESHNTLNVLLNLDPNNTEAMMLLSKIAFLQKRYDRQGELYHRILSVEPNHIPAQLKLATWYMQNQKEEHAEIILRNVLVNHEATAEQIKKAKWKIGVLHGINRQWDDAVTILSSVIDEKQNLKAEDWYRLAYACYQNYQIPESREYLIKSLELNPSYQNALSLQKKMRSGTGHSLELTGSQEKSSEPEPPEYWGKKYATNFRF